MIEGESKVGSWKAYRRALKKPEAGDKCCAIFARIRAVLPWESQERADLAVEIDVGFGEGGDVVEFHADSMASGATGGKGKGGSEIRTNS